MFSTIIRRVLQIYDIKMGLTNFSNIFTYILCVLYPRTLNLAISVAISIIQHHFRGQNYAHSTTALTEIIDMKMSLFIHNLLTLQKNFNTLQNWHENAKNSLYLKGLRL